LRFGSGVEEGKGVGVPEILVQLMGFRLSRLFLKWVEMNDLSKVLSWRWQLYRT